MRKLPALLALLVAVPVTAQYPATMAATMDVTPQPVFVTVTTPISWPASPQNVGPIRHDVNGRFDISGTNGTDYQISFTLPTELSNGSDIIPLSFGTESAETFCGVPGVLTVFDPAVGVASCELEDLGGSTGLFIGTSQPDGGVFADVGAVSVDTYTADITVTLILN